MRFKEIQKATKNFHHNRSLGEGVFGPVFKGWINEHTLCASNRRSGTAVAVKKWIQGSQPVYQEFLNEINYSSKLLHPNLVKLIGYCSEEDSLILVYEFMPRGSLDNQLFTGGKISLSWAKRIKIAIAAARALSFLHDLTTPVIHRCCQCSNILLDGEYNAKLSDFGLARDVPTGGTSHLATQVAGIHGTIAPEYAITGQFSEKSDAFSFGIVLLELLSGRRALDLTRPMEEQYLVEQAKQYLGDNKNVADY